MTSNDGAPDESDAGDLGERLAAWLDGLGLVPHLAEAGLPTFERDERGRARWTDPRTGAALSADQLAELHGLLHQEGSDPRHAVPVALVQLRQQARLRQVLLASSVHTYESLAELRGATLDGTRFAVHKAASSHRLVVVAVEGRTLVPGFQLTADGEVRPELLPVIEPLLAAGMDPWRAWAWLTQPAALLGGEVPERSVADPEDSVLVVRAAVRLAGRVGTGS